MNYLQKVGIEDGDMQIIVRQKYLDELIELYGTPDIKVITGIRRSGKSVLLQEFVAYLQTLAEQVNIVMINLQELEFDHLLEYHALHRYILDQYKEGMNNILLIDEVQMCPKFEFAINSIYTKWIYDIYITGSNAFLVYEAKRYDLKGKKYLGNNSKFYLCDSSFRYAVNGTRNMDFGRVYENIVYLELRRRGYEVYVGKLYKKEVNFVAKRRDEQIYIQVSDNISDEKTFEREYSPLLAIRDAYPKMIIARTRHETYDYQGVQVIDICRWLRDVTVTV
jgi:predicted AAA+ superfamily ATPase